MGKSELINRELSWLEFNDRVMQEARDSSVPLIQRLRFLGIFSNNLDEFFKVRVASLRRTIEARGSKNKVSDSRALMAQIGEKVTAVGSAFDALYSQIESELALKNIYILSETEISKPAQDFARQYFANTVSPLIVPLHISRTKRIPLLEDDRIYFAVEITKKDKHQYFVVEIPHQISRFLVLPAPEGQTHVMFLDDVIRLCLDEIFFMFDFTSAAAYTFKLTRDAEITLDDDISKSVMEKMELSLTARTAGRPVRLVYDGDMPDALLGLLMSKFGLKKGGNVNSGARYHQMRDLMKFPKIDPTLEYNIPQPIQHHNIRPFESILSVIASKDILLSYPYHSFNHFIDFLREAAIDPKVEAIYTTLYRVADRSRVVNALISAAKNGKKVVVLVELLARFDEENNLEWTDFLQRGGVKVINGVEGLKVHSKLVLVQRREKGELKGYTYVGTGNLNENTAKIYTDLGLLTSHAGIAADAMKVFDFLQHNHRRFDPRHLLVSPWSMRRTFEKLIEREIAAAKAGKEAYISIKLNSLTDEAMITLLYRASAAGVKVRMVVRSACCLMAGVKGVSENIAARSIVDMYLEHPRYALFCNGGNESAYIMSADFMVRNFDRRIEVGTPIYDKSIGRTLHDMFEIQWADNCKARDLASGESNEYVHNDSKTIRSQMAMYDYFKGGH